MSEELKALVGDGEFFVNGDTFDLVFAPEGTNFANAHKIVGRFACGETAYKLPSIVATLLNAALASGTPTEAEPGEAEVSFTLVRVPNGDLTRGWQVLRDGRPISGLFDLRQDGLAALAEFQSTALRSTTPASEQMEICDDCTGAGDDGHGHICGKCDGAGGYPAVAVDDDALVEGRYYDAEGFAVTLGYDRYGPVSPMRERLQSLQASVRVKDEALEEARAFMNAPGYSDRSATLAKIDAALSDQQGGE